MGVLDTFWNEVDQVLGVAQAVAPIVAAVDPGGSAVSTVQHAVAAVTPVIDAVLAAGNGQLTDAQVADRTGQVIMAAANLAAASGKLSQPADTLVNALTPVITTAIAARKTPGQ